eukprot:GHVS01040108.1.p1 GENE.GHVS01040108.1~~GHVS01040108.1.p1  ORF type:complete len:597 (-),score=87.20 GHVS01040108.1:137-1828(-)
MASHLPHSSFLSESHGSFLGTAPRAYCGTPSTLPSTPATCHSDALPSHDSPCSVLPAHHRFSSPGAHPVHNPFTPPAPKSGSHPVHHNPFTTSEETSSVFCERDGGEEGSKKTCGVEDMISTFGHMSFEVDRWTQTAGMAKAGTYEDRLKGCKSFRMMLSVSGDIPIQAVIDTGVVPSLVGYLQNDLSPDLQFEAAWALTNIASGTSQQTQVVVDNNGVNEFVRLLTSDREDIREQGMWGLGNISGDRPELRDVVLSTPSALHDFVQTILKAGRVTTIKTGVWAFTNLCRGHPRPDSRPFVEANVVECLVGLIKRVHSQPDIISDACWALDGLASSPSGLTDLLRHDVPKLVVDLLSCNPSQRTQRAAVRLLGQISAGDTAETQAVIDAGGLAVGLGLLDSSRKLIRKDACWVLANVAAGTNAQKQALLEAGGFERLLKLFWRDEEVEVKKEAAWAVCHVIGRAEDGVCRHQLERLVSLHGVSALADMLDIPDSQLLVLVVEAVDCLLKISREYGQQLLSVAVLESGVLGKMVNVLKCNEDVTVHCKIHELLHKYDLVGGAIC